MRFLQAMPMALAAATAVAAAALAQESPWPCTLDATSTPYTLTWTISLEHVGESSDTFTYPGSPTNCDTFIHSDCHSQVSLSASGVATYQPPYSLTISQSVTNVESLSSQDDHTVVCPLGTTTCRIQVSASLVEGPYENLDATLRRELRNRTCAGFQDRHLEPGDYTYNPLADFPNWAQGSAHRSVTKTGDGCEYPPGSEVSWETSGEIFDHIAFGSYPNPWGILPYDAASRTYRLSKVIPISAWRVEAGTCGDDELELTLTAVLEPHPLVDLSILEATPVQAALTVAEPHRLPDINNNGIGDLVAAKPTAFIVTVEVNNPALLPVDLVDVSVDFDGHRLVGAVPKGDFRLDGTRYVGEVILESLLPLSGDKITYAVDPGNLIPETDESDESNTRDDPVEVKTTSPVEIAYVPIPNCSGPISCYPDPDFWRDWPRTMVEGTTFVRATYPTASVHDTVETSLHGNPDNLLHCVDAEGNKADCLDPDSEAIDTVGLLEDMYNVAVYTAIESPQSRVGVGLVPPGYFAYHLIGALGLTFPYSRGGLVAVGYPSTVAHEIGHMLGLEPWPPEEYSRSPLGGNPAEGYYVGTGARSRAESASKEANLCFMGTAPYPEWPVLGADGDPPERWIDDDHWVELFKTLRTNPRDPEVLVIGGIIRKDGSVDLKSWHALPSGVADTSPPGDPDLAIRVLDAAGHQLVEYTRPVTFVISVDPLGAFRTDAVPLVARIEFPKTAASVEIVRKDTVVARVSPVSKVLRDSINAIPAAGFRHRPDRGYILNRSLPNSDRRKALLDEIDALEKQLAEGSYAEALDRLTNVIRKQVVRWLIDGYPTTSPLEPTKEQLLQVIDMMIERVSNMMGA